MIDTAEEETSESSEKYLPDRVFIKKNEYQHKVMYEDILYVEADRAYCRIVTLENSFTLSQTLKKIEDRIKVPYLLRVHRSFIINTQNVEQL